MRQEQNLKLSGRDGESTINTTSKTTNRTTESKHVETKTTVSSTITATKTTAHTIKIIDPEGGSKDEITLTKTDGLLQKEFI